MEVRPDVPKTTTQNDVWEEVSFTSQPLRPLGEVLGLCPPTTKPLIYTLKDTSNWPGPSMKKERRRKKRRRIRKEKEIPSVTTESPEDQRTTVVVPEVTDNLLGKTSTCSSIFSSVEDTVPSIQSQDIVPPSLAEDAVLSTHPKDVAPTVSLKTVNPPVQFSDTSLCSEAETMLGMSQPRKKARKRRRTTSKLSLSQNSQRQQQQQQSSQSTDDIQFLKEVAHNPVSISSSCCSTNNQTNQDSTGSIDQSRYIARRDPLSGSENLLASFKLKDVGQPAKSLKQSVHTLSHSQVQAAPCTIDKNAESNAKFTTSPEHQHTNNKAGRHQKRIVSFQSPSSPVAQGSHGHRKSNSHTGAQISCFKRQENLTRTSSSEDSDLSVYFEACSHLSILESCSGPSGIQKSPECPTGEASQPVKQKGDADTSSSSISFRESDYPSHSFSSSGSSTFVSESVLNKTVIKNKQQASNAYTRVVHEATSRSQERSKRMEELVMGPPGCGTKTPQQKKVELSCSTSECLTEEESSSQHLQEARETDIRADSRLSSSTVSTPSSSSSSSSVLTQAGKGCIQTIGEVIKQYFGGTVEDNLTMLQRNDFNLLQCLLELQTASSSQPCPTLPHHPSPRADL